MSDAERVVKHLEMIQGSIQRMAGNSFRLRGWSVVLVAGWLVSLARAQVGTTSPVSEAAPSRFLVLIPFLLMFALDGYYLWQERLFRGLYDAIRSRDATDFSMNTATVQVDKGYWSALFSRTTLAFHGVIVILLVLVEQANA